MSIKNPTRADFILIPIVILLGAAIAVGENLLLGATPQDQVLERVLVAAVLVAAAVGLGLWYIRVDARLHGVSEEAAGAPPHARTR